MHDFESLDLKDFSNFPQLLKKIDFSSTYPTKNPTNKLLQFTTSSDKLGYLTQGLKASWSDCINAARKLSETRP